MVALKEAFQSKALPVAVTVRPEHHSIVRPLDDTSIPKAPHGPKTG